MRSPRWSSGRWPIAGQFEARFLALAARGAARDAPGSPALLCGASPPPEQLLPWFIAVSNIESREPAVVRAGNERVVRPRLADAAFFWEQDRRTPLAAQRRGARARHLPGATGLDRRQGPARRRAWRPALAATCGASPARVARAALLCKCDLLSSMVGRISGTAGRDGRLLRAGRRRGRRDRDRDPRALPAAQRGRSAARRRRPGRRSHWPTGSIRSPGIFAIGQKPTGTRDPFGLRRAAIGVLRISRERSPRFRPARAAWSRRSRRSRSRSWRRVAPQ